MPRLTERRSLFRRLLPTARKIQVARSIASAHLVNLESVLVIGVGEDPYRSDIQQAKIYIRLDVEHIRGKVDVVADAVALPFPENSFACIISTEVLEYVFQPQRFIAEVYRVLRPGGIAIVTVPFLFNYHNDYWRPTRRALEDLFRVYSTVSVRAQGNRLLTIWDLITTSFWPHTVLMPLRIFSNLLYLMPTQLICGDTGSSAPTGFTVTARKRSDAE